MGGDYSRFTFDPKRDFGGVLMQQGRVHLDADWNEQMAIYDRRWRAESIDTMGPTAVPATTMDGFRIDLVGGAIEIQPGRMYVDGLLAENHGAGPVVFDPVLAELTGTTALDYGQQPYLPAAPALPVDGPHIVYLDVWQRECGHLQQDLIEKAVGVDTTTRLQTAWQVKVLELDTQGPVDCADSIPEWEALTTPSAGRLSTGTAPAAGQPDPCLIPPGAAYRGLENRLYRIQVHAGGPVGVARFKWSRVNASVASAVDEMLSQGQLRLRTLGRDLDLGFRIGDWVELTDDHLEFGSAPGLGGLPGHTAKITDVDEDNRVVTIDPAVPVSLNFDAVDAERHTRLIRWDQTQDLDADGLMTVSAGPIDLEDGVQISFAIDPGVPNGEFKTGDYWVFHTRTVDASVEQLQQAPPRGTHHHFARLAMVTFPDQVEDCRTPWPPWKIEQGCCTLTVGDGKNSHGDYESIQEAIDKLPAQGGQVCVLAGTYSESILIRGLENVTVRGCGKRSFIQGLAATDPEDVGGAQAVIAIVDSRNIRIESLRIEAPKETTGVVAAITGETPIDVANIALDRLCISARRRSAIEVWNVEGMEITHCDVNMAPVSTLWPAVFFQGRQALIERNNLVASRPDDSSDSGDSLVPGRGGLQLAGGCEKVRVINNRIRGGSGNGITLGSLEIVNQDGGRIESGIPAAKAPHDPCEPCAPGSTRIPPTVDEADGSTRYRSGGPLYGIAIRRNRISRMQLNGIGVVGFFPTGTLADAVLVEALDIEANNIRECLHGELEQIPEDMHDDMAYGGIALAHVIDLSIVGNRIEANGPTEIEPVCGIFVLDGESLEIDGNQIRDNGRRSGAPRVDLKRGRRGGIEIVSAVAPEDLWDGGERSVQSPSGRHAARIHDNVVIQPAGRALNLTAAGPVAVTANHLVSLGVVSQSAPNTDDAATVKIVNLSVARDLPAAAQSFGMAAHTKAAGVSKAAVTVENGRYVTNAAVAGDDKNVPTRGNVLFTDNQCLLDAVFDRETQADSSILIATLDDLAFADNQCDCALRNGFLMTHALLWGITTRVADNRIKEGLSEAVLSGVSFGALNNTTNNQSTHCIVVRASAAGQKVDSGNLVRINPEICGRLKQVFAGKNS